jgi:hypothetical protein
MEASLGAKRAKQNPFVLSLSKHMRHVLRLRSGRTGRWVPGAGNRRPEMIDLFSLGLTHALLMLAAWRLINRPDLDEDGGAETRKAWGPRRDA